jgi:hypothetical protein
LIPVGRQPQLKSDETDKKSDADTIKKLDLIEPKKVGKRWVVGINREAKRLGETTEQYFSRWKNAIKNSKLSDKLLDSVLSHIDYNAFYGLGVIVITLPSQSELSYLDGQVYSRKGDSTEHAASPMQIASAASRFSKS